MKPLRIGFVGAGVNTREKHLPGFRALPAVELTAVANRSVESSEKVAREHGIGRVARDWRDIVAAPDIDAVCIGTWPYLHAEVTIAALRAGKHVLTEARMAATLAEAEAMLAEARRQRHLVAHVVPAPMSLPFDAEITARLAAGQLGELREVCVTHTTSLYADASSPLAWRQDAALSGVNTLTLGIYYEMVLRWLGRDVSSVVADAALFTRHRHDPSTHQPRDVKIPESVSVLGNYPDGARFIGHWSGVELGPSRNEIRLNGARGGLRLDLAAQQLFWTPLGGNEERVEVPAERRGRWEVEADFVAGIREGKPVRLTDFATGVATMRFTQAVWDSWQDQGRRVTL